MSERVRVKGRMVIAEGGRGPLRWVITAHDEALGLYSLRERNAIMRACIQRAGDYWIAYWLPKRFDLVYAERNLNYKTTWGYEVKKNKKTSVMESLVWSGELKEGMNGATAVSAVGPSGPSATLHLPLPSHNVAPIVQATLLTIPADEVQAMATEFERRLVQIFRGSDTSDPRRSKLGAAQRGKLGLGTTRGRPPGTYSRKQRA